MFFVDLINSLSSKDHGQLQNNCQEDDSEHTQTEHNTKTAPSLTQHYQHIPFMLGHSDIKVSKAEDTMKR